MNAAKSPNVSSIPLSIRIDRQKTCETNNALYRVLDRTNRP
jgi:hypothetical protein